jgi:hypothetical protein
MQDDNILSDNVKPVKGGTPSKNKIYARIAAHADEIIDSLLELAKSKNENIKLGALKVLANKIIPDLKALEVKDDKGNTLNVIVIPAELMNKYGIAVQTPPDTIGSGDGSDEIQSS